MTSLDGKLPCSCHRLEDFSRRLFTHAKVITNFFNELREPILPNIFFIKRIFISSLENKLGCFIVNELFFYATKHTSLATKVGKRRKTKFGRIDSWSSSKDVMVLVEVMKDFVSIALEL